MLEAIATLDNHGNRIAYQALPGTVPGVIFLPGFASDMTGSKAEFLAIKAQREGFAFTRLDYAGHGQSGGAFQECTLRTWLSDALAVLDAATIGPQIVVGSSMGGWLALHLALQRPGRVAGIIGIAAAPDFTEDLVWQNLDEAGRQRLAETGYIEDGSEYGPPLIMTRGLIASGRELLVLRRPLPIACPVRLLHGMQDASVPWQTSLRLAEVVKGQDVQVQLIKDGEHRLSRDSDLDLLGAAVSLLQAQIIPI